MDAPEIKQQKFSFDNSSYKVKEKVMPIKFVDDNSYSHFYQFCNIVIDCNCKNNTSSFLWNICKICLCIFVGITIIIVIYKKHKKEFDKTKTVVHFYNSMYEKAKKLSANYPNKQNMETKLWTDAQFFFASFIIGSIKESNENGIPIEDIAVDNLLYLKNRVSALDILIELFCNNISSIILILLAIINPNELPAIITILTLVAAFVAKIVVSQEPNKGAFGIISLTGNLLEKVCYSLLKNDSQEDKKAEAKKVCLEFFGNTFNDIYKECTELEESEKNTPTSKK